MPFPRTQHQARQ